MKAPGGWERPCRTTQVCPRMLRWDRGLKTSQHGDGAELQRVDTEPSTLKPKLLMRKSQQSWLINEAFWTKLTKLGEEPWGL